MAGYGIGDVTSTESGRIERSGWSARSPARRLPTWTARMSSTTVPCRRSGMNGDGGAAGDGANRAELKVQARDHAEISAAAAQRPEEVLVLGGAGGDEAAVGRHDLRRQQAI